jgi:transcriptional antiterminator NusG
MMTDENPTPEIEHKSEPAAEGAESAAAPQPDAVAESAVATEEPPAKPSKKRWYVVKVQSGREDSIKEAIERRVKIEGLEEFFGQVVVPVERYTEVRKTDGKRISKKRKKFPGYLMAEVEFNDKILYLFRETSGVGDFVGASLTRAPSPMTDREVQQMLSGQEELPEGTKLPTPVAPTKIPFNVGDKVKVRDGTFQNMEGEIKEIREPKDSKDTYRIKVELTVWGRPVSVEVDYWQIDHV